MDEVTFKDIPIGMVVVEAGPDEEVAENWITGGLDASRMVMAELLCEPNVALVDVVRVKVRILVGP